MQCSADKVYVTRGAIIHDHLAAVMNPSNDGIVEAHCYVVTTGGEILMSIYVRSRINQSIATETSCNQLLLID